MIKRNDINKILIIGAGAVNVGNSGELDYFCRNVCISLKEAGYTTILVNPNPSSEANDSGIADISYIEALNVERLIEIIKKERPDAIMPAFGASMSLTMCHELEIRGILDDYAIKLLGTPCYAIECSESMIKFKNIMDSLGIKTQKFRNASTIDKAFAAADELGYPVSIHPEFSLSGNEESIAYNADELRSVVSQRLNASTTGNLILCKAHPDWYNYVLEIMRDARNNKIVVSTIENLNPLGVHSGDSISVSPILTLNNEELSQLKDYAIKIAEAMQIIGFADIKFSQNPETGEFNVVSVSPAITCMTSISTLVSGIKTSSVCAKLCMGESLEDIIFENKPLSQYVFDYDDVFVKLPRWPFDIYKTADNTLNSTMKAAGYVAGVAKTFPEALQKAVRSLQTNCYGLGMNTKFSSLSKNELLSRLITPTSDMLFIMYEALKKGIKPEELSKLTNIKPFFIEKMHELCEMEIRLLRYKNKMPIEPVLAEAKKLGFSDKYIADLLNICEDDIRKERNDIGIAKGWEAIGENQRFSTYTHRQQRDISNKPKIIVIGSGANKIGQGMEYDYSVVKASEKIKSLGYESIVINCNPTASSASIGIYDKVYFEPLTLEDILAVCEIEKPDGVIAGLCGNNSYTLLKGLENAGLKLLGYGSDTIKNCSDKSYFKDIMNEMNICIPQSQISGDMEEAIAIAQQIGYPIVVKQINNKKAKYRTMYSSGVFLDYIETINISENNPVSIESFLNHSVECEVDIISDGENIFIPGLIEHIESAGINSGDAACIIPSKNIPDSICNKIYEASTKIALLTGIKGLFNVRFAIDTDKIYLLNVIPGTSRTVCVENKIFGIDMVSHAVEVMVKDTVLAPISSKAPENYGVIEVVFPWRIFPECDPLLGRDTYSTGMVLGTGKTSGEAFKKAQEATGTPLPETGNVFISVNDFDKAELVNLAKSFYNAGFNIIATSGCAKLINDAGIPVEVIKKLYEGRPNVLDAMINGKIQIVINTPTDDESIVDDSYIRKASVRLSIAYMTTMAAAKAAASGLKKHTEE